MKTVTIALKELKSFFTSPIAYVVGFVAVAIFNVFFYLLIDQNQEASLRDIVSVMEFMNVFFIPLLTMRLLSEERSQGTLELLLTTPTRTWSIVRGKFLGTWIFVSLLMSVVWVYFGIMTVFSKPDPAETLSGWLGLLLESGFFIAVGMMVSSWTRHQLAAAIGAVFILFLLFMMPVAESYAPGYWILLLKTAGTSYHLENFTTGFFGIADVVYYVMGIAVALTVTRYASEYRLWH